MGKENKYSQSWNYNGKDQHIWGLLCVKSLKFPLSKVYLCLVTSSLVCYPEFSLWIYFDHEITCLVLEHITIRCTSHYMIYGVHWPRCRHGYSSIYCCQCILDLLLWSSIFQAILDWTRTNISQQLDCSIRIFISLCVEYELSVTLQHHSNMFSANTRKPRHNIDFTNPANSGVT